MFHPIASVSLSPLARSVSSPASVTIDTELERDIQSAAGANSHVFVELDGGTVTLTGYIEDGYALQAVEQVASLYGAETVIINILQKS